jgi:hypothetical protein
MLFDFFRKLFSRAARSHGNFGIYGNHGNRLG